MIPGNSNELARAKEKAVVVDGPEKGKPNEVNLQQRSTRNK